MHNVSPARVAALAALSRWGVRADARGRAGGNIKAEDIISDESVAAGLDRRDRALALELFYGVIRNLTRLDHTISLFLRQKETKLDPEVANVLRLGAYQILYLDRVPPHAAVNEAVEQAKKLFGRGMGSFTNAVLRSLIRGKDALRLPDRDKDPVAYLALKHSFPAWMVHRWLGRFRLDGANALMAASNTVPPLTLRANTLKISRAELEALLIGAGIDATQARYAPDGLAVRTDSPVRELPGYDDGLFAVQDEAAQLVTMLLQPGPGELILDACAAPGGKTAHIAAISGGGARIVAADIGLDKSMLMKENIARLGIENVGQVVTDMTGRLPFAGRFDRILLDAPCSALGIIRRRPEVKHLRTASDIPRLAKVQAAMLKNAAMCLKPGGVLVYSTCSTEPEEGEQVVEGFLRATDEFVSGMADGLLPDAASGMVTKEGYMRSYPHLHGTDGFFAARITRKA